MQGHTKEYENAYNDYSYLYKPNKNVQVNGIVIAYTNVY